MTNDTHHQLQIVNSGRYDSESISAARDLVATMFAEEEAARDDWADGDDFEGYGPDIDPFDDLPEIDIIIQNCFEC
jgi:hypothetical protein